MSRPLVNVTVPVFNEEIRLRAGLPQLHRFLAALGPWAFQIVIADNGSTDGTLAVAREFGRECPSVSVIHTDEKGRGRALKQAWFQSQADILTYMDVDLATDLAAFPSLVKALTDGQCDLAIGSRLLPESRVHRGWRREVISRTYMRLVRLFCQARFSDAQCGFKALRREAAQGLLPLVEDKGWFFDTELLVLAERLGYRIGEVPVTWIEDPDSRVRVLSTAWTDLCGLLRLRRKLRRNTYCRLASTATGEAKPVAKPD